MVYSPIPFDPQDVTWDEELRAMSSNSRKRVSLLGALAAAACLPAACATSVERPESGDVEEVEEQESALIACGAARYNAALVHYKTAVAWSKDRLANGVCNSDNGFQWSIADEASRAVMTCGAFRDVIRTSPWAAPIRNALAPSLTLRSLTGELLVIKRSSWARWTDVETFFADGLSFWARAEGAYGPRVRIDFRAGGAATWGEHVYDETTGDITWGTGPATYTIASVDGASSGPRVVTVVHAGVTHAFRLNVDEPIEYRGAPIFTLEPQGAPGPAQPPKLFSLVSECDA